MKRPKVIVIKKPDTKKPIIQIEEDSLTTEEIAAIHSRLEKHCLSLSFRNGLFYSTPSVLISENDSIEIALPKLSDFKCVSQDIKSLSKDLLEEILEVWRNTPNNPFPLSTVALVKGVPNSLPIIHNPIEELDFIPSPIKEQVRAALDKSYPFSGWLSWFLITIPDDNNPPTITTIGEYNPSNPSHKSSVLKDLSQFHHLMPDNLFRLFVNEASSANLISLPVIQ